MHFTETPLKGAFLITPDRHQDERGYFARTWCRKEALVHGLDPEVVQCSLSHNVRRGTLRGMHYQLPPCAEAKLVRCASGAIYDVLIDLRPESPTFLNWYGAELTRDNGRLLYIPRNFAHGFLTLDDMTEVVYQMSEYYVMDLARGFRWNDPRVGIAWPFAPSVISERDRHYADLRVESLRTAMTGEATGRSGKENYPKRAGVKASQSWTPT